MSFGVTKLCINKATPALRAGGTATDRTGSVEARCGDDTRRTVVQASLLLGSATYRGSSAGSQRMRQLAGYFLHSPEKRRNSGERVREN